MVINLHVISGSDVLDRVPPLDALKEIPLQNYFSDATNNELQLNIKRHTANFQSVGCTSATLHEVVHRYIPENSGFPAKDIALVFAYSWHSNRSGLYGLMFDWDGYEEAVDEQMYSGSVHRQACAVFLNAIRGKDREERIIHTAIHELGHVFNLIHDLNNDSFMAKDVDVLSATFKWLDQKKLRQAARGGWYYAPGGENFGIHESSSARSYYYGGLNPYLTLSAAIEKKDFLLGEPIALDLELVNESKESLKVRPELDPGYTTLSIWHVNPLGERRLFRPRMRFCRRQDKRTSLSPKRPIRNNPRISHGQIGTELTRPGEYIAWAEFDTGLDDESPMVVSNKVKFRIIEPGDEESFDVSSGLMSTAISSFTLNKGGIHDNDVISHIEQFANKYRNQEAIGHLRYALARYYTDLEDFNSACDCLCDLHLPKGLAAKGMKRLNKFLKKNF